MQAGTLSIVATPIGNLEDMTLRALRVLKEADYVLCEDTRVAGKLLKHYDIEAKLKRYDAHASEKVHDDIIADLEAGKRIALVSDAGTPGISDPGALLVARARQARDVRIETVPGPSSVTAAFSIAGVLGNQFAFLGFVPQKKGRQTFFERLPAYEMPVVFLESTHRIMKTFSSLEEVLGETDTTVIVARELTKLHEELVRGSAADVHAYFTEHRDHQKGEFVLIITPGT